MKTDILIIGAGPYGISLYSELVRLKLNAVVIGIPFSLWMDHMIPQLNLRSNVQASEIYSIDGRYSWEKYFLTTGIKTLINSELRIPVSWFQKYVQWVLQQLPDLIEEKITLLEYVQGNFIAITTTGKKIEAKKVVIATGVEDHIFVPPELSLLDSTKIIHSYYTEKYAKLMKKNILVIGGGQSAADTLVALSSENTLTWVHRKPIIYYHEPLNIPQFIFNILHRLTPVFYYLPRAMNTFFGEKFTTPTIDPVVKSALSCVNTHEIQMTIQRLNLTEKKNKIYSQTLNKKFDYIISCTGYQFQLSSFQFLGSSLKNKIILNNQKTPKLNWKFETNIPGMYMIGGISEFSHGPALRFMMGCRQTTLNVSRALKNDNFAA